MLSGSTPVPELIGHPLGFLLLLGLYGGGAVLVWEALARWKKGWLAVVPLGAAYGIAEEGLATKTFTDPHQQFVITGIPGSYGNFARIEWVTFAGIDPFHAAVSMGLPFLLVALLFPELRGRSVVSNRGLMVSCTAFIAVVTLMFFTTDTDPILPLAAPLAFIGALGALFIAFGWKLPRGFLSSWMRSPAPTASPRSFFVVGFAWLFSLLFMFSIGSHIVPSARLLILFFLGSGAASLYFLLTRSGWHDNRKQKVAWVGGFSAAFLVWDAFLDVIGDIAVLAFSVSLAALVVWLWQHPAGYLRPDSVEPQRSSN